MKVVDTNVLLYAVDESSRFHPAAHVWLTRALSGSETVGFPWVAVLGFVRISTNPRILPRPLALEHAEELVTSWLGQPTAVVVHPGRDHSASVFRLLAESGTAGNFTTDAHIAALALENRAEVVSFNRDLGRFGVKVVVPEL